MQLVLAVLSAMLMTMSIVSGANPHFVRANAQLIREADLKAVFKEAGLGRNENVTIQLSADTKALWGCINRGGNHPQAANKEYAYGQATESGEFNSGRNGHVIGSLTIDLADVAMPDDWSCPRGQKAVLFEVAYGDIQLCDETNGVCVELGGLSRAFWP
jgi:hypothetical protein